MTLPIERYRGSLLGLAVGDALGTSLEFKSPGSFEPIGDMIGGGPFNLKPGQWTDDTAMALCLASSLVEAEYSPLDQMQRYLRWYREGYMSCTGNCFDIGFTVKNALERFEQEGDPNAGSVDPHTAGNGSLMRLAPVPLFFAGDPRQAIEMAGDSSRRTHGALTAVDACRYMASLLVGAVHGMSKEVLLSPRFCLNNHYWQSQPLCPEIDEIAAGSFKQKSPPGIKGSGYVVQALEAALWALHNSTNFREGALLAVNLGDDADTTGAIYGQLAGTYYGERAIPQEWRDKLATRELIEQLADGIFALSQQRTHKILNADVDRR